MFSRRTLLATAGAAGALSSAAEACTFVGRRKPIAFSDAGCRRSLRDLVELIHAAPALSAEALQERADGFGTFAEDVSDPILDYPNLSPVENADLIRGWSRSNGHDDAAPIVLREVNLLKASKGIALYQFTLRRRRYNRGVTEEESRRDSCGMGEVEPFFETQDASYLGLFRNNRLHEVSAFDAWLSEA